MTRFLIPKAGIAQMPSINTPTICRLLHVGAGLSLAHPRPLRIRKLLRDIKNKSISVEWYANRYCVCLRAYVPRSTQEYKCHYARICVDSFAQFGLRTTAYRVSINAALHHIVSDIEGMLRAA